MTTRLPDEPAPDDGRGRWSPIPGSLDELTPEFLARVVDDRIIDIRVEELVASVGILGALARVELSYEIPHTGPSSVVVKLPTSAPKNREVGLAFGFYEREGRFYSDLAQECGLTTPKCFLAHTVPEAEEFILVLEDLGAFEQVDQSAGLEGERAGSAVRALAGMHARWWSVDRLDHFGWLPRIDDDLEGQLTNALYQEQWATFLDRFGSLLSRSQVAAGESIRNHFPSVINQLGAAPTTLNHGDFRVGNLFFGLGSECPVVAIDWQIVMRARGALDLAYLVAGSMTPEGRRHNEADLIATYQSALVGAGVTGYTESDCWNDYRWALMYCTVYPIDAASFELRDHQAVTMVAEWAERFFTAVSDLDCADLVG